MQQIKRGDIYYADLNPYIGSEQGGVRPILIVQNDIGNKYSSTIIAAVITSQTKTELPTHVKIKGYGLNKNSTICLEQIRTIDKCRLREYIGCLDDEIMEKVDSAINVSFGIQIRKEGQAVPDLKVIETGLIKVYETDKGEKVVNARELHCGLQSKQDFSTWVKIRLGECDSVENKDYIRFHKKMEANNATMTEYILKLSIAKEMAMLERNEKGKLYRKYLIDVEEKYKSQFQLQFNIPQTLPEALRFAADLAEENAKLLPKANSFDSFMNSEGNLTVEETAKTLNIKGIGRNNLFKILTNEKILFRKSGDYEAYQNYVDSGYFVHKQNPIKKGDVIEQRTQVFVTPKGLDWLSKKMKKRNYIN